MASENPTFIKSPLKVPPQDIDAEKALLGAILIKSRAINDIMDTVAPNHFYAQKHRMIFETMLKLDAENNPIDMVTLTSALRKNNILDKVGGSSYLAELVNFVPSAGNLSQYADLVSKKAALRELIGAAESLLEVGYADSDDIDHALDQAEKILHNFAGLAKKKFLSLKDTLVEAWERFEKLHNSDEALRGIPTGFAGLDNLLAGLQPSDLIILAARPSMGKTSFALDIARNTACRHNIPVCIFSLEMSAQQLADRMIAAESRVDAWKLRVGKIRDDNDLTKIRDAMDTLSKAQIYIDDEPGNNIVKMRSVARRLKAEGKLGLIVVDYLQLMIPRRQNDSIVQQVTELSRSLKGLARELDVPVLALSQLNRSVEQRGGRPRLSDLRDSGSIEQDADVVMFIHREDKMDSTMEKNNIAQILIEKHRNGPTGMTELYFDGAHVSFMDIEKGDFKKAGDFGAF